MKKAIFLFILITAVMISFANGAIAQSRTTGAIQGRVTDDQGAALPGAEVKITSPDLIGGSQSKITDEEGKYRFVLLPRGTYTVEAVMSGFTPTKSGNIRLFVGQTITVDLVLQIGTLAEEVLVQGKAPLVDVKDSQLLTTNIDRETIQQVGQTRSKISTGLIDLAPGSADSSVMGASARVSNNWQIDGMNMTWLAYGADGEYPDLTILEEVQVAGIGANAEYGNFTGAAMNVITKSGGNSLEGFAEVTYSGLGWVEKNFTAEEPKFSLYSEPPRQMYFDAHFGLGGPIVKDKLWFYISGGQHREDQEIEGFEKRRVMTMPSAFAKLTFQLSSRSRFQLLWEYELFKMTNRGLSPSRPLEACYEDIGPGMPLGLSFWHTFSSNTFLEMSVGYWKLWYEQRPNNGRDVSQRLDYNTGQYSGNYGWWGREDTEHVSVHAKLSYYADEFIKGSHDFKFGVEYLSGYEKFVGGYPGGYTYLDIYDEYSQQLFSYAYSFTYNTNAKARKTTVFVQDSWHISDRLTINPGLRYSVYRGTLPNVPDLSFKPRNAYEPRLGLTWDLFGDHTTALKVHYGRYIDSIKTALYQGADSANGDFVMYYVLPDASKIELFRLKFSNPTTIDPDIRMPHSDQFSLGFERTLAKNLAVGATFIHRNFQNFIARVNTNSTWIESPFTFKDENGAVQTVSVYEKTSPDSQDQFVITNPDPAEHSSVIVKPKNTFTGVTLFFEKRFSDNWMLHIDYTYGRAKGNHANDFSGGSGLTTNYLNPNLQINAEGDLDYDPRHNLQIYGTVILPLDFTLSPRLSYISGNTFTRTARVPVYGFPAVMIEPRGSQRMSARIDLDLRAEKFFRFSEKSRLALAVEVFNLFNRGVERYIYTDVTTETYGKAYYVYPGRYIRLSARVYF